MTWDQGLHREVTTIAEEPGLRELTYLEAIRDALRYELARDERVLLMGEDIGVYGGAFKVTQGLIEEFGPDRVIDTPMAELAMLYAAVGMSFEGFRPVVEMQFADFISTGFDALVQFAATNHFRWGQPVPITVRAPGGGGLRAGPFHSQSNEAWFVHTPGLKVVAPATPADARGLLIAAIRDPNPVMVFEHKLLYRVKGPVPEELYAEPIGKAAVRRRGDHLTIIAYSIMVGRALEAAGQLAAEGIEAEVIDLRSLRPLDEATIVESVRRTGRVLVVHEAVRTGGFGGEVVARIAESEAFDFLDAPIRRLAGRETPIPYNRNLERSAVPQVEDIVAAARSLARE